MSNGHPNGQGTLGPSNGDATAATDRNPKTPGHANGQGNGLNGHPGPTDSTPLSIQGGASSWGSRWGPWTLDPDAMSLALMDANGNARYGVDLERCQSSAEVLDWLTQVAGKRWADDETLAGLLRALRDVLRPQTNLCSFGNDRTLSADEVRSLVEASADRRAER